MAIKLDSSAPAPTDRERIWATIRSLGQFTRMQLALQTGLSRTSSAISDYLKGLEKAGFIKVVGPQKVGVSNQYELVRDIGVEAPRVSRAGDVLPPSGRSRMWKTMRILGTFTTPELANAASLEEAPIALSEAEYYCRWLCQGGYLRGDGKRWTFVRAMNTGPKAPQILRVKKLYDPNRDAIVCEGQSKGRDDI